MLLWSVSCMFTGRKPQLFYSDTLPFPRLHGWFDLQVVGMTPSWHFRLKVWCLLYHALWCKLFTCFHTNFWAKIGSKWLPLVGSCMNVKIVLWYQLKIRKMLMFHRQGKRHPEAFSWNFGKVFPILNWYQRTPFSIHAETTDRQPLAEISSKVFIHHLSHNCAYKPV